MKNILERLERIHQEFEYLIDHKSINIKDYEHIRLRLKIEIDRMEKLLK